MQAGEGYPRRLLGRTLELRPMLCKPQLQIGGPGHTLKFKRQLRIKWKRNLKKEREREREILVYALDCKTVGR